ncbi:MAG: hypothetical protein FWC36_06555 [Spirochaetes bacterium]|nr:hypothetical protein [Spirochaetota bacterium]
MYESKRRKEKNRVKTIKFTMLMLFSLIILLWVVLSVVFIFAYTNFIGAPAGEAFAIFSSLPFILYLCAISFAGMFILFKITITTRILDNYAILSSEDINRMIAKNTAPLRERYYFLYNSARQKDKKITLLRKHLEKLHAKNKTNV